MKLLFVIGSMQGGGAEHVLATECNNLAERGHEIILVYDFRWKDYYISYKDIAAGYIGNRMQLMKLIP